MGSVLRDGKMGVNWSANPGPLRGSRLRTRGRRSGPDAPDSDECAPRATSTERVPAQERSCSSASGQLRRGATVGHCLAVRQERRPGLPGTACIQSVRPICAKSTTCERSADDYD